MRVLPFVAALVVATLSFPAIPSGAATEKPKVNYVSAEAVYLNVGRLAGVAKGSRIRVLRSGKTVAILKVLHVSSHSASCRVVEGPGKPRAGDSIRYKWVKAKKPKGVTIPKRPGKKARREAARTRPKNRANRLSGFLSMETYWDQDMTGASLTSIQPAASGRIIISNVLGTGGEIKVRHRSRLYYRPGAKTIENRKVWSHRLTEAALRFGGHDSGMSVGIGRMVIDDLYGLGFVDGAFVTRQISPRYRIGVAGGLEADASGGGLHTERQKIGAYLTWEKELKNHRRLSLTGAVAGSYNGGFVNREFMYLQGIYTMGQLFYVYQSVEVDYNRSWRKTINGSMVTFSNYVLSASSSPLSFFSVDFNYDARHNTRTWYNRATPDTLFDDDVYSGLGGGATLSLPGGVRIRGNGGWRFRGISEQLNRYYSVSADVWGLLPRGHGVSLRYSVSQTPFIKGYRPTVSYRFPINRFLRANAGAGAYIYEQGPLITRTYYFEGGVNWSIGQRYFVAADLRQNVGGDIDAIQVFAESGINF